MVTTNELTLTKDEQAYLNSYIKVQELRELEVADLKGYLSDALFGHYFKRLFFPYKYDESTGKTDESTLIHCEYDEGREFGKMLFLLRILKQSYEIAVSLKNNPLLAIARINDLESGAEWGSPGSRYFHGSLFDILNLDIDATLKTDEEFQNCRAYINAMIEAYHPAFSQPRELEKHLMWKSPDFDIALIYLETLSDFPAKIKHLKTLLIECEAYHRDPFNAPNDPDDYESSNYAMVRENFIQLCKIHIEKYEQLLSLESHDINSAKAEADNIAEPEEKEQTKYEKHPEMTLDRAILILNMIVPGFEGALNTKKAEFVKFLTGLGKPGSDYNRQRFSSISLKEKDQESAYKADMKVIRKHLREIGIYDPKREQ